MDVITLDYICKSSDYDRFGILDLIANVDNTDNLWFLTRPSYADRNQETLNAIEVDDVSDCGSQKVTGLYQAFVLTFLP